MSLARNEGVVEVFGTGMLKLIDHPGALMPWILAGKDAATRTGFVQPSVDLL